VITISCFEPAFWTPSVPFWSWSWTP